LSSSIFSDCPYVERKAGKLLARTDSLWGFDSLDVTVDPVRYQVVLARQFFWFFKTKRIVPFDKIRCITYDYQGPSGSRVVRWLSDHDIAEVFFVGLKLEDETVPLFEFRNEEEESKDFVEQLSEMIGVPIGRT
jgi:hypothetical protein